MHFIWISFDSLHDADVDHVPWYGLVRDLSYDKFEKLKINFDSKTDTKEKSPIGRDEFKKMIGEVFGKSHT